MLIRDIATLKLFVEPSTKVDFAAFKPSIGTAEDKYIIPCIGADTYELLDGKLDNNAVLNDAETALLKHLRNAIAQFGMYLYSFRADVMVSDSGITRQETQSGKTAFKYQLLALRDSYLTAGFDALERALDYLERNSDDFATWEDSAEREEMNSLLIRLGADFNRHYSGIKHPQRTYRAILSDIRNTEELTLLPMFGNTYITLKSRQVSNSLTLLDKELIRYLKTALCNYAFARAITKLQVRIDDGGITILGTGTDQSLNDDSKRIGASKDQVAALIADCEKTAGGYIQLATDFLNANASAVLYPDWFAAMDSGSSHIDINDSLNGIYSM